MKATLFSKAKALLAGVVTTFAGQAPAAPTVAVPTPDNPAAPVGYLPMAGWSTPAGRPGIQAYRAWRKKRAKMRAASIRAHR